MVFPTKERDAYLLFTKSMKRYDKNALSQQYIISFTEANKNKTWNSGLHKFSAARECRKASYAHKSPLAKTTNLTKH